MLLSLQLPMACTMVDTGTMQGQCSDTQGYHHSELTLGIHSFKCSKSYSSRVPEVNSRVKPSPSAIQQSP